VTDDQPKEEQSPARGPDLVRETLARAKADARARAAQQARITRSDARTRSRAEQEREASEPLALGAAVRDLLDERGWAAEAAAGSVLANWEALVGPEVAARSRPVQLRAGELQVEAESTAWATQLRLLSRQLLDRLTTELGPGIVTRLVIRGPAGPDWRHGRLRVRGPGPRDTYG
jgi:predicted nucleic acid-binding Zn ribbon protein